MRRARSAIRWTAVLSLATAVLGSLGQTGCERTQPPDPIPEPKTLVVLTPHSAPIRETFAAGFWDWYQAKTGVPVRIEWVYRGTPQCTEYLREVAEIRSGGGRQPLPDVMFGGGIGDHRRLAAVGLSRSVSLLDAMRGVPPTVLGLPTRDETGRWYATGLSTFGIVYNHAACAARAIAPPSNWSDLADPRFFGWVAVADPRSSGSHRECFALILQAHGWRDGWATIVRILANARALNARSQDALNQVASGVALATFAVNFDGMALASERGGIVRYIDPPRATAASPDVISVVSTCRDVELAKEFVRFVLSDDGQALWSVAKEHRRQPGETLYHYPIRPSIYEKYAGRMSVEHNPLESEFGLEVDPDQAAWQARLLDTLVAAACAGDNHVRLQKAWRAVIDAGLPADTVALLAEPPFDEDAAAEFGALLETDDPETAAQLHAEWAEALATRYARTLETVAP